MSTAVAPDHTLPVIGGRHHFLLKRLHSLTGLIFGGYLVFHLLVNATIVQFHMEEARVIADVYQTQVGMIHSLPFLTILEWTFIYIPILFHMIYGVWITFTGQPNVNRYPYTKNYFYVLQRISGFIIALFLFFHVLSLKYHAFGLPFAFDPFNATKTVASHMDVHWTLPWVVYPLGVLASCFHLANGVWAAGITWGLTVSANAQRRWGWVCVGLFLVTTSAGFVAVIAAATLDPAIIPLRERPIP